MTTVFTVFEEVEYTYLEIKRGRVYGNQIVNETTLTGIFKDREGMLSQMNQETRESSATIHAHPEDFEGVQEIVGNGIRYNGKTYSIIGVTEGRNFDTNEVEHLTFTLERAKYDENDS